MSLYLQNITARELATIADAASKLLNGIERHLTKPYECSGPGKVELMELALELERGLNPDKLRFDDPHRVAIRPTNWPTSVWVDLRNIRYHFDNVIRVCAWKDLCNGPSPLRAYEPIPLNGFVGWPKKAISVEDLAIIKTAAERLQRTAKDALNADVPAKTIIGSPTPLQHASQAGGIQTPTLQPANRRRRRQTTPRNLTAKQLEAVECFGKSECNYSETSRRLGLSIPATKDRIQAAYKKLGQRVPTKAKTEALRADQRGGVVASRDRRRD